MRHHKETCFIFFNIFTQKFIVFLLIILYFLPLLKNAQASITSPGKHLFKRRGEQKIINSRKYTLLFYNFYNCHIINIFLLRFYQMHQYIQYGVIGDSKHIACILLSLGKYMIIFNNSKLLGLSLYEGHVRITMVPMKF